MQKTDKAKDFQGREVEKGDTVSLLSDNSSAKIAEVARDFEQDFVRLRPLHQPYGKGVWHAADRVVWQSSNRKSKSGTGESSSTSDGDASDDKKQSTAREGRTARARKK